MFGAFDRIAANADTGGLAKPHIRGLFHRLIGERAGAGHNPDRAALVNMAGHNADFTGIRRDHPGAVWPDQDRAAVFQRPFDLHHIQHRNAFGDGHNQLHFGINGLKDTIGGKGWRHIDHRGIGAGDVLCFMHRVEHWQVKMALPAFAGGHPAHHFGAIGNRLL